MKALLAEEDNHMYHSDMVFCNHIELNVKNTKELNVSVCHKVVFSNGVSNSDEIVRELFFCEEFIVGLVKWL